LNQFFIDAEKTMMMKSPIPDQKGFTLIEFIAIMVIMGVLASVAVKRYDQLSGGATERVLLDGVKELNARESLIWTDIKLSSANWANDAEVFSRMDTNLGADFNWAVGPTATGGTLQFRDQSKGLTRAASTNSAAGRWN
jgi:prepilin-type N-terminal cleavage/methylation domain-containing protein